MAHIERDITRIRRPVVGHRGMVATTEPLATAAGLEILAASGNAADAAIATAAALAVVEPNNTGLGGDCFALYFDAKTGEISALNASGRAPAALTLDRVAKEGIHSALPVDHPHSVTVPGACAGWFDLIERHGTRSMKEILLPAIRLADEGFPVAAFNSVLWRFAANNQLGRSPGGQELMIDGKGPGPGEVFRNPTLARTLRLIAEGGRSAYYEGEIAEAIVSTLREFGGVMSEADLAEHRSTWDVPLSIEYGGLRVWECPPNGQGLACLLALNILRGMDLADLDPLGTERFHVMIEAMRLAFADARWYIADPAHSEIPIEALLCEAYGAERRALIDLSRATADLRRGTPTARSDTVYFCCVDGEGNACSFINSNYMSFGTGIVPVGYGFPLQNRGHGFSLDADHPNALAPGKRPYHTIIPGMLTRESDGSLYGPFGVMGGFMQPQGHMQVVLAMALDGLDPQAALDRPRFNIVDGEAASRIELEPRVPTTTFEALSALGHSVGRGDGATQALFGRGQIIRREANGVLWGGTDPRADGCVMTL